MQFRKFKDTDIKLSTLGFGCMRLPIKEEGKPETIDYDISIKLVRDAIDNGVNYIDTAYPYHGGVSQQFVAAALKDGYREKVHIATKLPPWICEEYDDFERTLDKQLSDLETETIDFYLLHALNSGSWAKIRDLGVIKFLEKARADGKIKFIGFSIHDSFDCLKEILDYYSWDFCQLQFNYLDIYAQTRLEGLRYAGEKGVPVVIMEPLKGGSLAKKQPDHIVDIWKKSGLNLSAAELGMKYVLDFPEVVTVLSGMNAKEQVDENIAIMENATPNHLSKEEFDTYEKVANELRKLNKVPCTNCQYCVPCPKNVSINECFNKYNNGYANNNIEWAKSEYLKDEFALKNGANCVSCGICVPKCPQGINIPLELGKITADWQ